MSENRGMQLDLILELYGTLWYYSTPRYTMLHRFVNIIVEGSIDSVRTK